MTSRPTTTTMKRTAVAAAIGAASIFAGQQFISSASTFDPGERIAVDSEIKGAGGAVLRYQGDGNLVLYGPSGPLWATGTSAAPGHAEMQGDGNVVLYDAAGTPYWASNTNAPGAWLEITSEGLFLKATTTIWRTPEFAGPGPIEPPPPSQALPALRVQGNKRYFETVHGVRFDFREVSEFALLSRMLRGEGESHVRPLLRQLRALGFTSTRVLLTLDGGYWHDQNPIGYSLRSAPDMAGYWDRLDELVAMHEQEGLYARLTIFGALEPFGGVWDPIARRDIFKGDVRIRAEAFALEVARRMSNRTNVLLELANEPVGIGFKDSSRALQELGCRVEQAAPALLLTAGDINGMEFERFFHRCFDFVDRHVDRSPEIEFFAFVKRMGEDPYRDSQPAGLEKPAVSGEPVNFGEARVDGRTGDIATLPEVAYAYGAVTRVRQILPNFHYDGGLWATAPKPETVELMRAFHRALNAIPMGEGNRWRGNHSLSAGNYWSNAPYPGDDDERTVRDHLRNGRGPWRVFGLDVWSVAFPEPRNWDWQRHLTAPATRTDHFTGNSYDVDIYRRQ